MNDLAERILGVPQSSKRPVPLYAILEDARLSADRALDVAWAIDRLVISGRVRYAPGVRYAYRPPP